MTFKRSALNNLFFSTKLNENFVCTYKQVSSFRVESQTPKYGQLRKARKHPTANDPNVRKSGGDIVSYFCDSSGRVLEIFAGPRNPKELLEVASRVTQFNTSLASTPANEQSDLARAYLRDLIDDDVSDDFDNFAEGFSDVKSNDEGTLRKILTFNMFRGKVLTQSEYQAVLKWQSYRFRENLLLQRHPLPKIEDIEKPVFECLTGNDYKVASPEYNRRLQQFTEANESGKYILAVMLDDRRNPWRETKVNQKPKYIAPDINTVTSYNAISKNLEQFEIVDVMHDDLFRILSELGKEPMRFKKNRTIDKNGIGYIVFDPDAKVMKILPPDTKLPDLSRAMRLAANK